MYASISVYLYICISVHVCMLCYVMLCCVVLCCVALCYVMLCIVCMYVYLCVHVDICMCMYLYICTSVYLYICISVYLYICISAYLYICICTHVHTHTYVWPRAIQKNILRVGKVTYSIRPLDGYSVTRGQIECDEEKKRGKRSKWRHKLRLAPSGEWEAS